ncbi:MAG: pepsin-like aspartyl protease [Myxococcales bacterium]
MPRRSLAALAALVACGKSSAPPPIELQGCPEIGYAAPFTIGGETFQLGVDTGSSTLAVAASACVDCGAVEPRYTPGPGAVDQNSGVEIAYGDGQSWAGEIFDDQVEIDGLGASQRMPVVAIVSQDGGFFQSFPCTAGGANVAPQGIAGFGPAGLAAPDTQSVAAALPAFGLPEIFAVELCQNGGKLWLGGWDPSAATAPPFYAPLAASKYYAVDVLDLQVGGQSLGFGAATFGPAVVDTGTSALLVPTPVYGPLVTALAAVPAFQASFGTAGWFSASQCTVPLARPPPSPAELDQSLPWLTLAIAADGGSAPLTLSPTESYLLPYPDQGATYYCPSLGEGLPGAETVLGVAAMRAHLVIFDVDGGRLGFAPQKECQ